jgi:glycosyltransferase involved in cell wall biosynthesis
MNKDSNIFYNSVNGLYDINPEIREEQALNLAKFGDPSATLSLVDRLKKEDNLNVITTIIYALGEIGSEEAIGTLIEYSKSDICEIRWVAVEALGKFSSPNTSELLIKHLKNEKVANIRAAIVSSLTNFLSIKVVETLQSSLKNDEDISVRQEAYLSLTRLNRTSSTGNSRSDGEVAYPTINLTLVNQFFPPDYAATGTLIKELAHNLKDYGKIEVLTSRPSYPHVRGDIPHVEREDSLIVRRFKSGRTLPKGIWNKAFAGILFFMKIATYLLKHTDNEKLILLTTAPPFLPLLGYLLNRLQKIRYVCLLYDLYPEVLVNLNVLKKNKLAAGTWRIFNITKIWNHLNRLTWEKAESIIVLSETMKEQLLSKHPDIEPKVFVISSWADTDEIVPISKQNNPLAIKYGLVDSFTVLYAGNMGLSDDLETLYKVIFQLKDKPMKDKPIRFVFVGHGDNRQWFEQSIYENDLGENCLFLTDQSHENLPLLMTACDVSIVSIGTGMEGLLAPSELYPALASGRPLIGICAENSYLNEVFKFAHCGYTVRNGDYQGLIRYLYKLMRNPRLLQGLGLAGREYCHQHYDSRMISDYYLDVFQVLQSSGKSMSEYTNSLQDLKRRHSTSVSDNSNSIKVRVKS